MPIEHCIRCGRLVDLDRNVADIEYFDNKPVCFNCWTDKEREQVEKWNMIDKPQKE